MRPHASQYRVSVVVWAGVVGDLIVVSYLFSTPLTLKINSSFCKSYYQAYLTVPQPVRHHMWFQHVGVPHHYCRCVCELLNQVFGHQWIGHSGAVPCLQLSPYASSMCFSLEVRCTCGFQNGSGFKNRLCCFGYPPKSRYI
ncbi:hypothetical protein TNCV_2277931 [Trichonephila clavipes]|nr:hypothetical protein TNCV_2277931 [Trichonephila clavipes]